MTLRPQLLPLLVHLELLVLLLQIIFWSFLPCHGGPSPTIAIESENFSDVKSNLLGVVILPHGDASYDPNIHPKGSQSRQIAMEISKGAHEAGLWMDQKLLSSSEENITIFFSTPHGVSLKNDFGIYVNQAVYGSAPIGQDVQHEKNPHYVGYNITVPPIPIDVKLSQDLLSYLTTNNNNVTSIQTADEPSNILRWAEVIPTKFIPNSVERKHIFWTYPQRRYDKSVEMIPELLRLGSQIRQWMESRTENKFVVVISGDLSHTHRADGPYGYSNASEPMDKALSQWATGNICENSSFLLETAANYQTTGKSCGFTGFILLHGMLCGNHSINESSKRSVNKPSKRQQQQRQRQRRQQTSILYPHSSYNSFWNSTVLVNHNASYFGMMAAIIEPTNVVVVQDFQSTINE